MKVPLFSSIYNLPVTNLAKSVRKSRLPVIRRRVCRRRSPSLSLLPIFGKRPRANYLGRDRRFALIDTPCARAGAVQSWQWNRKKEEEEEEGKNERTFEMD